MEVRFFATKEMSVLQQAIHSMWAEKHILSRDQNLLRHMFYGNPLREDFCGVDNLSFVGLWDVDQIVGLLGLIPYHLNVNGTMRKGMAATNWIVRPEYAGYGLTLLKPAFRYNPDAMLFLGTNHATAKLYRMMRWPILNNVPRWVGIGSRKNVDEQLCHGNATLLQYWPEVKIQRVSGTSTMTSYLEPEKWDYYYWNVFAKQTIGFSRDYAYLKWRYLDHPAFNYQIIVSQDDQNNYIGLAVVRVESILNEKYKIGRIVEFISFSQLGSLSLANEIISRDNAILFWDFFSFSSITTFGLESVGFRRKPKWMDNEFFIPTRFQPLDLNTVNMVASMYLSKDMREKFNLLDDGQWYVTKGDSDQDRPN